MLKIMIVDDMDIVRLELKRLKIWGQETGFIIAEEARNGHDALVKLEQNSIDLVITDIRMPKLDGIELLKTITYKKLCPCVVLLSDHGEFSYARSGLVLGAFDYMVKPVNEQELVTLLRRVKEFIQVKKEEQETIILLKQKLEEKIEAFFPQAEVNRLIEFIKAGDTKSIEYAIHIIDIVYSSLNEDLIKTASLLNNIIYEIIENIWSSYQWLNKFKNENEFKMVDFLNIKDLEKMKDIFAEIIKKATLLIRKLQFGIHQNDIVNQVSRCVLENIDGAPSLKSVSELLFINKSYISEIFKQKTGTQFSEYITQVKLERAKKLIYDNRLKTYEVAGMLGFKDIEYFSRLFKKHIGYSPTEYRNNIIDKA